VERSPQAVAVIFEGEELSYAELKRAGPTSWRAVCGTKGIGPEDVVAAGASARWRWWWSLLGSSRSGADIFPLDPEYPQERLQFMLEERSLRC